MSTTTAARPRLARAGLHAAVAAGAIAACALGAADAGAQQTQRVDVYDARFAGEVWADGTAEQGRLKRVKRLKLAFASEATGLTFRGGQAQGEVPVAHHTPFQPRYTDVFTDPDWIDGECVADRWAAPTGGRLVVSDLVGENGGMVARFSPADRYDGGRTCTGRALGWSGPTTENGLAFDARFEVPRSEVGARVIQIPVQGQGGGCPMSPIDTSCDSRFEGEVTLTLRSQHVEDVPREPGTAPAGKAPATAPPGRGAPAQAPRPPAAKPGGVASGPSGKAGRKEGTVTVRCSTACTGRVSAYAVAKAKQAGRTAKPRLVGTGRLQRLRGGAVPRAAGGSVRMGARVRFRRGTRALVRSRGRIEYRITVRPEAGGPVQRMTVLAPVRR